MVMPSVGWLAVPAKTRSNVRSMKVSLLVVMTGMCLICLMHACTRHEIQIAPVEVKPIHITIDVNVRVDKALDDFFNDLDEQEEELDRRPSQKK
jgi:hypothetical protein